MRRSTIINSNNNSNNSQSHQRTSSDDKVKEMNVKNGEVTVNANSASLVGAMSTMSLEENCVEPYSSIPAFRILGIEQDPTVAGTST